MSIEITNDDELDALLYEDEDLWEVVEDGEWIQDYKYQHKNTVVKHVPTGKFYSYDISRSGSPFTDWEYSYSYGDYPDLYQVELKERTVVVKEWVAV